MMPITDENWRVLTHEEKQEYRKFAQQTWRPHTKNGREWYHPEIQREWELLDQQLKLTNEYLLESQNKTKETPKSLGLRAKLIRLMSKW